MEEQTYDLLVRIVQISNNNIVIWFGSSRRILYTCIIINPFVLATYCGIEIIETHMREFPLEHTHGINKNLTHYTSRVKHYNI